MALIVWWAAVVLLGLVFAPIAGRLFPPAFADRGLAFAKPLALVTLTYVSWLLTSLGLAHPWSLAATSVALAGIGAFGWRATSAPPRFEWMVHEAAFVGAFGFFAAIRALQPDVFGAEKFMDFAFFNTLLRGDHFPPEDPWLSGVPINYYYFGYLLFANLARLTGVEPAVAYNLSLATIGAVIFTAAVSIGRMLGGRLRDGFLAATALTLIGNLDGAIQLLIEQKPLSAFDYWRSTRVVPHTINEFPFFSLLHGDLHPHVTALVINVSLIGVALAASTSVAGRQAKPPAATDPLGNLGATSLPLERDRAAGASEGENVVVPRGSLVLQLGVLALLLGSLALANPWDVPVYFTLLGVLALHRWWDGARPILSLLRVGAGLALLGGVMLLLSLPFSLHFQAQYQGIGQVHARTPLPAFVTVFGFLLAPLLWALGRTLLEELDVEPARRDLVLAAGGFSFVALYVATLSPVLILTAAVVIAAATTLAGPSRSSPRALPFALAATAAIALGACEVVFLRDPYGADLHRMNTVFKLYFQAWLLLAVAFPAFVRLSLARLDGIARKTALAVGLTGLAASLCYPLGALALRWNAPATGLSLDGLRYLDREHPADAAAIRWLAAEIEGRPVVLEASGDPYTYFARVSSNTGLPTLIGWANHESVWRGSDGRFAERKRDVEILYREPDVERVRALLARYRVRYVFLGDLERERFPATGLAKFARHPESFAAVFESADTRVFRVLEVD